MQGCDILNVKKLKKYLLCATCICVCVTLLSGCMGADSDKNTEYQINKEGTIRIAVIDSGISADAIPKEFLAGGKNYVDSEAGTEDTYGHGTAVASVIFTEAKYRDFIFVPLINVMYDHGKLRRADGDTLALMIREAIDQFDCQIIHISAGIAEDQENLRDAVIYAAEKDVLIVAAVGNDYGENPGKRYYPAAYDSVVSVGALDTNGKRADFSQDWADVYRSGVDVPVSLMSGNEDTGTGTSYAAARFTAELLK